MSEQAITGQQIITVTPAAADKINMLLTERSIPDCALRVFVTGGGCSGMQYGMAFEPNPQEGDMVFEAGHGVRLVLDPISRPYIEGATIDFIDSLMGGGFKIENPNAVSSCGCGHSFRTSGSADTAGGAGCGCH
jgi:iron-sulfur cluster assembly protein